MYTYTYLLLICILHWIINWKYYWFHSSGFGLLMGHESQSYGSSNVKGN